MKRTANSNELYYFTLTVVDWIDIFTRREYKDLLVANLQYCQDKKHLEIFAYVIMTNHLHMVARCQKQSLGDLLRDYKTFTSKELYRMIHAHNGESRRQWMLSAFEKHGLANPLNKNIQIWQNGNHPTLLFSNAMIDQKVNYIHQNPVKAGFVNEDYEYLYLSASPLSPIKVLSL